MNDSSGVLRIFLFCTWQVFSLPPRRGEQARFIEFNLRPWRIPRGAVVLPLPLSLRYAGTS